MRKNVRSVQTGRGRKVPSLAGTLITRLIGVYAAVAAIALAFFLWHLGDLSEAHPNFEEHALIVEFVVEVLWVVPATFIASSLMVIAAVRRALRPLEEASNALDRALPELPVALDTDGLPRELRPMFEAVNGMARRLGDALRREREFVANAAHELRTPLAVIRIGAERVEPHGAQASLLAGIERMTRTTAQLTNLARVEGRSPMSHDVDIAAVARDVCCALAPVADARGIEMSLELGTASVSCSGDRVFVEDILRNIVENAVQHARTKVAIVVSGESLGRVTVEDDGVGIPEAAQDAVFDRFYRGYWSSHVGSGLGLSIVRTSAARIGAKLAVEPLSPGVRFRVDFAPSILVSPLLSVDRPVRV